MLGLWLAAYSVSGQTESARVRGSWFSRMPEAPADCPAKELDKSILRTRALIGYNADGCAWLVARPETVYRGLRARGARCEHLEALALLVLGVAATPDGGIIPADLAGKLANTFAVLLPHLEASCWYGTMVAIVDLMATAAAHGLSVTFS